MMFAKLIARVLHVNVHDITTLMFAYIRLREAKHTKIPTSPPRSLPPPAGGHQDIAQSCSRTRKPTYDYMTYSMATGHKDLHRNVCAQGCMHTSVRV